MFLAKAWSSKETFLSKNMVPRKSFHYLNSVGLWHKINVVIAVEELSTSIHWKNTEEKPNTFVADVEPFKYSLLCVLLVDIWKTKLLGLGFKLWPRHQ